MTTTDDLLADDLDAPPRLPEVGETFFFESTGFTFNESTMGSAGVVATRGSTWTVTADMVEASRDRKGNSWLTLLHDPDGQERRWGRVHFRPGTPPSNFLTTEPGTPEHNDDRRDAMRAANSLPTKAERDAARRDVEQRWGPAEPTSRSLARYSDKR